MGFFLYFIYFIFGFQRIKPFLIVSMIVKKVDDCIRKIELDDGTNLYERNNSLKCDHLQGKNLDYNKPIFEPIPFEIGQKIKIIIGNIFGPKGDNCGLNMDVFVNNNILENMNTKFWYCDNCYNDYSNNYGNYMLNCFPPSSIREKNNYTFYFNINSLEQLDFNISEYFYYLNNTNYFYISSLAFNDSINLIDLYSENYLYAQNSEGNSIKPFYKYI